MPDMNGFELGTKILKVDLNVKICFMSAGEVNHEAVRELYPTTSIGCFIKKPITIDYLLENKGRVILVVRTFHPEELTMMLYLVMQRIFLV